MSGNSGAIHAPPRGARQVAGCFLLAAGCGLIAACGQKGPLYLPDRGATVVTRPAPSAGAQSQSSSSSQSASRSASEGSPQSAPQSAPPR